MGYEKEREENNPKDKVCVVEAVDAEGRVVAREPFSSQDEGDAYAAEMRAKGFKVSQSGLEPTPQAG